MRATVHTALGTDPDPSAETAAPAASAHRPHCTQRTGHTATVRTVTSAQNAIKWLWKCVTMAIVERTSLLFVLSHGQDGRGNSESEGIYRRYTKCARGTKEDHAIQYVNSGRPFQTYNSWLCSHQVESSFAHLFCDRRGELLVVQHAVTVHIESVHDSRDLLLGDVLAKLSQHLAYLRRRDGAAARPRFERVSLSASECECCCLGFR